MPVNFIYLLASESWNQSKSILLKEFDYFDIFVVKKRKAKTRFSFFRFHSKLRDIHNSRNSDSDDLINIFSSYFSLKFNFMKEVKKKVCLDAFNLVYVDTQLTLDNFISIVRVKKDLSIDSTMCLVQVQKCCYAND